MRDKYLHFQKAGNQFVGRVVYALDVTSPIFSVTPPYFKMNTTDEVENMRKLVKRPTLMQKQP